MPRQCSNVHDVDCPITLGAAINSPPRYVFVTGGTGYMGRSLISALLPRGHKVRALARAGSQRRLPDGCELVTGDPLDRQTFASRIAPADTFVHLVGTPRPSPAKARQFLEIDLVSVREAVAAAVPARVSHFVYVSVAQPAPIMQAYLAVRAEGEAMIREAGLRATILRPWYVLGPGHRWPHLLRPAYAVFERMPSTRESAQRLGLVTLRQMIGALVAAIESPPDGIRIVEAPDIRRNAAAEQERT